MQKIYWTVPKIWSGETVSILACGPSLKNLDVESIRGPVIAINDAFLRCDFADVLYFCDKIWWLDYESEVRQHFKGKHIVTLENQIPGVHALRNTGITGFDPSPDSLRHGRNSGYQAIHLAAHLGAGRILLYGYDMHVDRGGQLHWGKRKRETMTYNTYDYLLRNVMLPNFKTLKEPLEQMGIEVLNATPGSALTVWKNIS